MNKKRGIAAIVSLVLAFTVLFSGCGDGSKSSYPDYKAPDSLNGPVGDDVNDDSAYVQYTVNTLSAGGLPLDGVTISITKNGLYVMDVVSMSGQATFKLAPDDYDLEYSNLPKGYSVTENTVSVLTPVIRTINAVFTSSVIPSGTATSYTLGDVMYDFSFTEVAEDKTRTSYSLAELFADGKTKAVVLNFWYVSCSWCIKEFPYIETAYSSFENSNPGLLKFVALSKTDAESAITKFKADNGYSFIMARDNAGITNAFGITGYPTTIVIDRYGVVAYAKEDADLSVTSWLTLFATFTSDSYSQDGIDQGGGDDNQDDTIVQKVPDIDYPTEAALNNANGNTGVTFENLSEENADSANDLAYNWPWLPASDGDGAYLTPGNVGEDFSWSMVKTKLSLKEHDVVSIDYNLSTQDQQDNVYVMIDNAIALTLTGDSKGWQRAVALIADRDRQIELTLIYYKDDVSASAGFTEFVKIRNLAVTPADEYVADESIDALRSVVNVESAAELGSFSYPAVVTADQITAESASVIYLNDDGYYHIIDGTGADAILLFSLVTSNSWTQLHYDGKTTETVEIDGEEIQYAVNLWDIIFYQFFYPVQDEYTDDDGNVTVTTVLNGKEYTSSINVWVDEAGASNNNMLPVTETAKAMIDDFCKEFASRNDGADYYENQWLEFCSYYKHYGAEHKANQACLKDVDPAKGMNIHSAYVAYEGLNHADISYVRANSSRGTRYKFTAEKAGAYSFQSLATSNALNPQLMILDENGKILSFYDEVREYDRFVVGSQYYYNFKAYYYLDAGETIYLNCCLGAGETGEYDFLIEYLGETADALLSCTTEDGLWTYDLNGNVFYACVPVTRIDGYYYHVADNGEVGSKIYIDFVRPNYYDNNNHSLLEMIDAGYFKFGTTDYTAIIKQYYNQSVQGKAVDDPEYGLVEASTELVELLDALIAAYDSDYMPNAYGWCAFACYYETIDADFVAPPFE